jgi:hypothetical protein
MVPRLQLEGIQNLLRFHDCCLLHTAQKRTTTQQRGSLYVAAPNSADTGGLSCLFASSWLPSRFLTRAVHLLNPIPITLYSIQKMKPSSSSSTAAAVPPAASGPVTVTSVDVLSGRYNYSFNHEGNNFFRDAIQDNREEYQAASRRAVKNQITQSVIRLVQAERGGRFLKLNDKNQWEVMSDDMVYEKVSHALRGSKKKYMQSKKSQKDKNKKSLTAEAGAANANNNNAAATATATSTTGSASSAASSTGEPATKGATSYQALASPFVNRAYQDIMARQKVIFEGMVNGSMLQGSEEDDGDPSVDGGNNSNSNDEEDDEDDYHDNSNGEDDDDDGGDNDSAAYLSSRRRDSNATELSSCGGASAAHVAVAARALVAAMRQQDRRDEEEA